jgi:uncharacterized repeat protein (TIGR01451 family)
MKKTLIFLLAASWLSTQAQQQTFDYFKWDEVSHPFSKTDYQKDFNGIPQQNVDASGKAWYARKDETSIVFYNNSDNTTLSKPFPVAHKVGYSYWPQTVTVGKDDAKLVVMSGSYYLNLKYYYHSYVAMYDKDGNQTYLFQDPSDTTFLRQAHAVNGNVLIMPNTCYGCQPFVYWNGVKTPTSATQAFYDGDETIYCVQSGLDGLHTFHSDGTDLARLAGKKVFHFEYDTLNKSLIVYSNDAVYKYKGKAESIIDIPNYSFLKKEYLQTTQIDFKDSKYKLVLSKTGFSIGENNTYTTYAFNRHPELGQDSLEVISVYSKPAFIQDDSTLVMVYKKYNPTTSSTRYYLFTYKNKVAKFHKSIQLNGVGDYHHTCAYVGKDKTYFYANGWNEIVQAIDTVVTKIPVPQTSVCNRYVSYGEMVADKDFLWVRNTNDTLTNSSCNIMRMRHSDYFVNGKVYYDFNKNGYQDQNETSYNKIKLAAKPSGLELFPDHEGRFAFKGEPGKTYSISVKDSARFTYITQNNNTIGVKLAEEKPEVLISSWLPRARCFTAPVANFGLHNTGVVPVEKIIVKLAAKNFQLLKDSVLVDTATFSYQNLPAGKLTNVQYNIQWPDQSLTGEIATLYTITELYVGSALASVKKDSVQTTIRCSYDPNDKSVTPSGVGNSRYTLKNSTLKYQIRFENTGNDTAYHVVIRDTLSNLLDLSTFEVQGASHRVNTELSLNGIVAFHFNYIMLPDTGVDKQGAQGYVTFSIKPKTTVADYTLLCNKAAIYFDQNPPIITNDACNLLVERIPTVVSGLETTNSNVKASIFPNPASDLVNLPKDMESASIYNAIGEEMMKANTPSVNISHLHNGVYFVKTRLKNGQTQTDKLSVVK